MRPFVYVMIFSALGCAHRRANTAFLEANMPVYAVYADHGVDVTASPNAMHAPRGRLGPEVKDIPYSHCGAVPIAENTLVTSLSIFGGGFKVADGFGKQLVRVVIGGEPIIQLDDPVYDEPSGFVFLKTRRPIAAPEFRKEPLDKAEPLTVQGVAFGEKSVVMDGYLMPAVTSVKARSGRLFEGQVLFHAESDATFCVARVNDAEGRLVAIMRHGSGSYHSATPVANVLEALERVRSKLPH